MTIYTFGHGDELALPKLLPSGSPLGSEVHYTHPDYNSCYSKYGFACPLNYESLPLHILLDNKLPVIPDTTYRFENSCEYLLVDHNGNLWKVSVCLKITDNRSISYTQAYIDKDTTGWWIGIDNSASSTSSLTLLGFLFTNPPREAIDAFWYKHHKGLTLEWFSVSDIVKRLNNDYPQTTPKMIEEETNKLLDEKR